MYVYLQQENADTIVCICVELNIKLSTTTTTTISIHRRWIIELMKDRYQQQQHFVVERFFLYETHNFDDSIHGFGKIFNSMYLL